MEHLLFLAHRIPYPPNKGDKIRSWHLLAHLTRRYHVHLGCFIDDPQDWQYTDKLKQVCEDTHFARLHPLKARLRSLAALAGGRALTLDYYRDASLQAWVDGFKERHPRARVLVFSSAMAQYAAGMTGSRRVIDFVDVDSDKWRQYAANKRWPMSWLYRREGRELLRYEREVAGEFDASLFVSQAEAGLFRQLAPESAGKTGFFNNGVDTAYFSPRHTFANPFANPHPADTAPIVFTGAMDYWPNVDAVQWLAREVLPAVRERHPEARFIIVGSRPAPEVRALASQPGVEVTGTVPDVRPYLAHAAIAVAPLRIARGIQNKVLEAMAMAKTVVVTPQALEGISARPGQELLLAQDAQQFIEALCKQLEQPDLRLGIAARLKVETAYGWDSNLACVDALLEPNQPQPEPAMP
jgi:sugar transferase (PEP-CTERM/EpsH1 system associated)